MSPELIVEAQSKSSIFSSTVLIFLSDIASDIIGLRWFIFTAFVLLVCDLRFGVEAAKIRGEVVRFSRAMRRTLNKFVDYLCWLFIAGSIGRAFGDPFELHLLTAGVLVLIYGIELNSCFSNYFEARGIRKRVNVFKWVARHFKIFDGLIEDEKPHTHDEDGEKREG